MERNAETEKWIKDIVKKSQEEEEVKPHTITLPDNEKIEKLTKNLTSQHADKK